MLARWPVASRSPTRAARDSSPPRVTPTPLPSLPHRDLDVLGLDAGALRLSAHLFGVMRPTDMVSPEACSSGKASPVSPAMVAVAERPSEAAALQALVDRVRTVDVDAVREVRCLTRASMK